MKKQLLILLAIGYTFSVLAQRTEFTTYPNGLIYSDKTMTKLSHIVDSLNLKFKVCDANPQYFSLPKVIVNRISLEAGKDTIDAAIISLKNNMSLAAFEKKYPQADVSDSVHLLMRTFQDKQNKTMLELLRFPGGYYLWNEDFEMEMPSKFDKNTTNIWFSKTAKSWRDTNKVTLEAVVFLTPPQKQTVAPEYARMIQYSDCVIDTTNGLYLGITHYGRYEAEIQVSEKDSLAVQTFINLFENEPVKPNTYKYLKDYAQKNKIEDAWSVKDSVFQLSAAYKDYLKAEQKWENDRALFIKKALATPNFNALKAKALEVAFRTGYAARGLDYVAALANDKEASLRLKRSYRVVGGCSMDESPRFHLQNIAMLSAETTNWESFLRAHLDVMNDRVQRVSDGSYAYGRRQTYIRELEELGLDIPKLLIGTCLRFDKPADNHYFGNVSRIGRALAETKYAEQVQTQLLEMIKDPKLDDFNRYICFYVFKNYIYHLEDKEKQRIQSEKLEIARQSLPEYIADALKNNKE